MSKKIELKPVPLTKPEDRRKSIDTEVQTNPISKRDLVPEFELVGIDDQNEESSKTRPEQVGAAPARAEPKAGRRQKKRAASKEKVPEYTAFEFELSEDQLKTLQSAPKEHRIAEMAEMITNVTFEQSDGYFKENPHLKKYFEKFCNRYKKQLTSFREARHEQVA